MRTYSGQLRGVPRLGGEAAQQVQRADGGVEQPQRRRDEARLPAQYLLGGHSEWGRKINESKFLHPVIYVCKKV